MSCRPDGCVFASAAGVRRPTLLLAQFCAGLIVIGGIAPSAEQRAPADPYGIATICLPAVSAGGTPIAVASGDELQAALDRAMAGDTIVLAAGATFQSPAGGFTLRNRQLKAGQWITIRSSSAAFDAGGAVPAGVRVTPAAADALALVRATRPNVPAIKSEPGARGYRLIGLDVGAADGIDDTNLIEFGDGTDKDVATEPSDIVIDRCVVHGNDAGRYRRGVALNGARLAVVDSYFANFHDGNTDSQAIAGWNGPGPFKIVNNYLEAASENIMFGGGDPAVANLVPSDIEVRRNLSTKRLAWRSAGVAVKNAFELKNARRVLVSGNVFENVWASGQDGTAILLKSVNQDGRCTWCVTEYVLFTGNIVRAAAHGLIVNAVETGAAGQPLPVPANHIRIENDLFDGIGASPFNGGKLFRIFGGVDHVEITHVTSMSNPTGILDPKNPSDRNPNLTFSYNIVERSLFGIGAGGDEGIPTLTRNFAPFVYNQNVLVNTSGTTDQSINDSTLKSRYPPVTFVAPGWPSVGLASGTLSSGSPYYRAGTDGKDLGADMSAIAAAQAGPLTTAPCTTAIAVPRGNR
jgi:hypothetical protein